jgi:type I restriction enzyme, S subunit
VSDNPSHINNEISALPPGWSWSNLDDVVEIILGQSPKSSTYNDEGIGLPFFQGKSEFGELHPTVQKWCSTPNKIANAGDVLLSIRAPVGATNIATERCCIGRGLAALHPLTEVNPLFILYLIRAFERKIAEQSTGSIFDAITGERLRKIEVPLPPLPEQHRIVTKIEELFTQLDAGVASLKKAQAQLKRYRQAVLKAAFEGRLTKMWREEHKGEIEPTDLLLNKTRDKVILSEINKKIDIVNSDRSIRFELPNGWTWIKLDEISQKITDGTHITPTYIDKGVPFISVKDIFDKKVHFEKCKYISKEEHEKLIKRCHPENGDILITKSGTIGRTAVIKSSKEFSLFVSVALIKPYNKQISSDFIGYALDDYINNIDIQQTVKGGVIKNLHIEDIKEINIKFPPIVEQFKIVNEIERYFSIADKIETIITTSLLQAESLRQSILKRAFEGKLVPQDPNDEPASVLLERIKAEKALHQTKAKAPKTSKRKMTHAN